MPAEAGLLSFSSRLLPDSSVRIDCGESCDEWAGSSCRDVKGVGCCLLVQPRLGSERSERAEPAESLLQSLGRVPTDAIVQALGQASELARLLHDPLNSEQEGGSSPIVAVSPAVPTDRCRRRLC
jgi:hypothetical protein